MHRIGIKLLSLKKKRWLARRAPALNIALRWWRWQNPHPHHHRPLYQRYAVCLPGIHNAGRLPIYTAAHPVVSLTVIYCRVRSMSKHEFMTRSVENLLRGSRLSGPWQINPPSSGLETLSVTDAAPLRLISKKQKKSIVHLVFVFLFF